MSPWQQTSHSLYHQLSVRLPAGSHLYGAKGRGGIIFLSLVFTIRIFFWYYTLSPSIPPPTLSFHSVTFIYWSYHFVTSTILSIFTSSHLSDKLTFSLPSPSFSHHSKSPTYSTPPPTLRPPHPDSFQSPPLVERCEAWLRLLRAGSIAGSPSLTGNYTAEQQLLLRWAWETEMQKLWKEPVGWEGGRDGEAINRADWSWISCIGQAAGIEWPKLTALFSTFTAKASLFPGGLRTRESRRDNLMKMLPRCPLLTLLCREEPNGFGSLSKLKWFMCSFLNLTIRIGIYSEFILTIDEEMTLFFFIPLG